MTFTQLPHRDPDIGTYGEVYLPMFGAHQASNAACALAAVEAFAGVAETVYQLCVQDPSAWSFEVEARPFGETW